MDNLCFEESGVDFDVPSITIESVTQVAQNLSLIKKIDKNRDESDSYINLSDSNESDLSNSNEAKRLKIKKKFTKKYSKLNKVTLNNRLKEYEEHFISKNNRMFCKLCSEYVNYKHKNVIDDHIKSNKHQKYVCIDKNKSESSTLFKNQNIKEEFLNDLIIMMTANNIPLNKLDNKNLKNFFVKYCEMGKYIPSSVQMRKYISTVYDRQFQENLTLIKNAESFSIIVDETQDVKCRSVLNILIIPSPNYEIEENFKLKAILLDTIFLSTYVDSNTIVREINKAINKYGLNTENIFGYVTDNATYMVKSFETFNVLWENCIHVTCYSHIYNLIAETFQHSFNLVNKFLTKMKSFFKKSRLRQKIFFNTCGKAIPKTSMIRWNSWLEAVIIHDNLFSFYEKLISNLIEAKITSPLIKPLKNLIMNKNLRFQIKFLSSIAKPIINAILFSQKQDILSTEIHKSTLTLINIFRQIYSDLCKNDGVLKEFKNDLTKKDFISFKQTIIDGLNTTLIKFELYFDFGKQPALNFFKAMELFNPENIKDLVKQQKVISIF
jgi:hypothetical protein